MPTAPPGCGTPPAATGHANNDPERLNLFALREQEPALVFLEDEMLRRFREEIDAQFVTHPNRTPPAATLHRPPEVD